MLPAWETLSIWKWRRTAHRAPRAAQTQRLRIRVHLKMRVFRTEWGVLRELWYNGLTSAIGILAYRRCEVWDWKGLKERVRKGEGRRRGEIRAEEGDYWLNTSSSHDGHVRVSVHRLSFESPVWMDEIMEGEVGATASRVTIATRGENSNGDDRWSSFLCAKKASNPFSPDSPTSN